MNKVLFLPTGYQAPKAGNHYMKFQDGENKFRILSQPVLGWEDWQDKKPIRYRMDQKPAKPVDPTKAVKHFWAMIVWNYAMEEIQILHLTQASIRKSLEALCADQDWGAPYFYDLKVLKQGTNLETEYTLNPLPHKPLAPHIKQMFNERRCYLEALFDNEDPFSKEHPVFTPGIFSQEDAAQGVENISMEQAYDLEMILEECSPRYKDWVFGYIKSTYNADRLTDLPGNIYHKMKDAATKAMEKNHSEQRGEPQPIDLMEAVQ